MKRKVVSMILITLMAAAMCVSCGTKTCHYCGEQIAGDPLKKDGRYYCDYDCYMNEVFGFQLSEVHENRIYNDAIGY